MKKQLLLITGLLCITAITFAGGIVTNTNQSAAWVRTLVRDASISTDAVYFNPAGLIKLPDGFHLSINSQTIFQSKDVTNDYVFLQPSPKKFNGEVKAPVFPSIYAAWKKDKIALSFGFNPIGGGGGATFKKGLPSFETSVADLRKGFEAQGATEYNVDAYLKGTSVFFGYQLGVTYQINDMISVYGGLRYVTATNTYEGHLRSIYLIMGGNWVAGSDLVQNVANLAKGGGDGMQPLIDGGLGPLTADQALGAGYINQAQRDGIVNGLTALGVTGASSLTIAQSQATFYGISEGYDANANLLRGQKVDVEQNGSGFTPIIGVNISLGDKLNIGMKYEFKTSIKVKNDTRKDFILGYNAGVPETMFPDGEKIHNDLPAMFSLGVNYKVLPKLSAQVGFHYFWDKSANYGKQLDGVYVNNSKIIDKNYYELAIGLEYNVTEKWLVSAGYLLSKTGVSEDYQSDISFSLSSNTIGGGLGFKLNDKLMLNAGVSYSMYDKGTKSFTHIFPSPVTEIALKDTYYKNTLIFAIGADINF